VSNALTKIHTILYAFTLLNVYKRKNSRTLNIFTKNIIFCLLYYIMNELRHGVTIFPVKGGYTKEKQKMLMCVIPTREYYKLKEGIRKIDPESFFVITDSYEVKGGA